LVRNLPDCDESRRYDATAQLGVDTYIPNKMFASYVHVSIYLIKFV